MNVLAGLAEGVLDAILEREDDPRRDPFAVALARYRAGGVPQEAAPPWRATGRGVPAGSEASAVLRKLDRDLLSGILGYATGEAPAESPSETADREPSPTLAVMGSGGPMPSLEMAPDGTWHVAASAAAQARQTGDAARASVPTLASRYPTPRLVAGPTLRAPREPADPS